MSGRPSNQERKYYMRNKQVPIPEKSLRELFEKSDTDGDKKLSKAELKVAFERLGSRLPAFRAWLAMAKADGNRNGAIDLGGKELDDLVKYAFACNYDMN